MVYVTVIQQEGFNKMYVKQFRFESSYMGNT